jgi:hypothetical protein
LPERWDPRGGRTLLEQILGSMNDSSIKTPEDLIREISLATITSLEEPYKAALDESFLCIFEKSIAYIVNLFRLFPTFNLILIYPDTRGGQVL